ncbi:hypothetical protein [Halarsenatibacter silvermanii]|uniref:Uncharacterized protein n=1 Tax=Halarsenatibacter silvermanii TaxID=321763 RepID=A0A1G9RVJ0_9FIRM|nr:hypothetical protein [Halarsenatibacter silvermanii]SDM27308.1 hypothetical protein SAMN04488692_12424 [Halarsenatibacter silvermanii]
MVEVSVSIDKKLRNNLDAEGRKVLKNIKNNLKDLRQHIPIQYREIDFTISCDVDKKKIYVELNNPSEFAEDTADNLINNVIEMLKGLSLEDIIVDKSDSKAKIMFSLGDNGELRGCE